MLLSGAAIVTGSFLPWVRAEIRGHGVRVGTGWENVAGDVAHGPWFVLIGAVVVFAGLFALLSRSWKVRWLGAVGALAATVLAVTEMLDITSPGRGVTTHLLAGPWVMLAGGLVALLGAALMRERRVQRRAIVSDSTGAVGAVG